MRAHFLGIQQNCLRVLLVHGVARLSKTARLPDWSNGGRSMTLLKRGITVVILMFMSVFALAQGVGASGSIKGTITDPQGAVVPNAKVTATDPARGSQRSATTDDKGQYLLPNLAPATYN